MFLLTGCTSTQEEEPNNTDEFVGMYIDPITEGNPVEELGNDIHKKLSNYFGEPKDSFHAENLSLFGNLFL